MPRGLDVLFGRLGELGAKHRNAPVQNARGQRCSAGLSDDDQRVGASELGSKRRAQRAGGDDRAVADAAPAVNDQNRKILVQRWILEPVVHDNDVGPRGNCRGCARNPVARNDGWRDARKQQRFVADLGRVVE